MAQLVWHMTAAIAAFFFVGTLLGTLRSYICARRKKPQVERCWLARSVWLYFLFIMLLHDIDMYGWQDKWLLQIIMLTLNVAGTLFQWKICTGASVHDMIDKLFNNMYSSRCDVRSLYARLSSMDSSRKRKYNILYFGLWFVIAVISLMFDEPMIAAACFTMIFLGGFLIGLHSLRSILFAWFLESIAVICAIAMMKDSFHQNLIPASNELAIVIVYFQFCVYIWLIGITAADHDVGRLAAFTANTFTTVILIVVNVCTISADIGGFTISPSREFWTMLQSVSNYLLVPFVAAGYFAALVNEWMVYWESKKSHLRSESVEYGA